MVQVLVKDEAEIVQEDAVQALVETFSLNHFMLYFILFLFKLVHGTCTTISQMYKECVSIILLILFL